MKKTIRTIMAIIMSVSVILSTSITAFAATGYVNSVGSEGTDISVLDNADYSVAGNDSTQNKKSQYNKFSIAENEQEIDCDVYATIAEGSDVFDTDKNEFIDGAILVGVPTVLIMDGTPDQNGYYIAEGKGKVKGNIAGTTVINVIPSSEFKMTQTGKKDINAAVTQDVTKFTVPTSALTGDDVNKNVTPSFNDDAVFNITVKTNEATAGSWSGSYKTTISLSSI